MLFALCDEIHAAKYFSICVDSMPDVSHIDQLTFILQYVSNSGYPVERFLKFLPTFSHTSESLKQDVLKTLDELMLSLDDFRGQSYDNDANMSGKYGGLQA